MADWNIWTQPLACLIFYVSSLAESNRLPFDLSECEQELVGGYHTEYGGMKFVMFFLGEYTHVITISFLTAILFFGGWHFPWIATPESAYTGAWLVKFAVLLTKVLASIFLIMLIRWTIPRFRFDQLMELSVEGAHPAVAGERGGRDDGAAIRWDAGGYCRCCRSDCSCYGALFAAISKRYEIRNRRRASLAGA